MSVKFLYIDDEVNADITIPKGIVKQLCPVRNEVLEIDLKPALSWNKQLLFIKENIDKYNGILLDLKLIFSNEGEEILHYAPSLAQEFRSLAKRGEMKDFPIFLCSTDDILRSSYDTTSEDLFDECFYKLDLNQEYQVFFSDHAKAYKEIAKSKSSLGTLLSISDDNESILEDVIQYYYQFETIHAKAKFLLRKIIEPTGIFIDEDLLAIRLGVDKISSPPKEWEKLINELNCFKYKGVYSNAYPRWWMKSLFTWWSEKIPSAKNIMSLSAKERVDILDKIGFKNLTPLTSQAHQKSTKYWYKCANFLLEKEFDKELIPVADGDGFEFLYPTYPWQDVSIISKKYIWEQGSKEVIESVEKRLSPYFIDELAETLKNRDNL